MSRPERLGWQRKRVIGHHQKHDGFASEPISSLNDAGKKESMDHRLVALIAQLRSKRCPHCRKWIGTAT
jgi:hypothetical protein